MSRSYTTEQVAQLVERAVREAEQRIYTELRGASNEDRLNSLDTLDALHAVEKQLIILLSGDYSDE